MARGCALIDSRLDTATICSDKRVHVDHAQLPAVFGREKTFSHGLGQKRKCPRLHGTSVLPSRADIVRSPWHVCLVPNSEVAVLFDHLVGAGEQSWWHNDAKRFGGLEVDDQFEFRNLLHRQISRLVTLQDAAGIE